MRAAILDAVILGGLALQGFGLLTEYGPGMAATVVGSELLILGLLGMIR